MKFLAILRDSFREAIDTKVFYVMVGLSVLLIALAFSCTFKPRPGGEALMQMASTSLTIDMSDLNLDDPDPDLLFRRLRQGGARGVFQVTSVAPLADQPDAPSSTFRVELQAGLNPLAGLKRSESESLEEHIRKSFGVLDRWRIAEVIEVRRTDAPLIGGIHNPLSAQFEVLARVTPAGRRLWPHDFSLFFGALPLFKEGFPLAGELFLLENYLVNGIGAWVAILVSIVITAFFIPNMLRKGTVDLLLVKPIGRVTLLLYKYVGGLLFILLNTAVVVVGVWVALGLRSGIWTPVFLLSIPIITFFFAILYSVSTLFGVLTRSPIVAILLTCAVWFGLFVVGATHNFVETVRTADCRQRLRQGAPVLAGMAAIQASPLGQGPLLSLAASLALTPQAHAGVRGRPPHQPDQENPFGDVEQHPLTRPVIFDNGFTRTVAVLHYILPRTRNLDDLTTQLLLRDLVFSNRVGTQKLAPTPISWGESLTVSGIFVALMLGLACWRFATRDY